MNLMLSREFGGSYTAWMRGRPRQMTTDEAIGLIRNCVESGVRILGVDAFAVAPGGNRAELDLMLDVSERHLSAEEIASEAEAFIEHHARPDLVWEVWTDS